jgi:hypothetical protein
MNNAGNVTKNGEEDVDQKITTAATLEEDTQRWEEDGKDDLADVATGQDVSHVGDDASSIGTGPKHCIVAKVNAIGETYEAVKGILTVLGC